MENKVRKVIYTYQNPENYEFSEHLECKKECKDYVERKGFFHDWTNIEIQSPESGNYYIIKVALIEDLETGTVNKIGSDCFTFKTDDYE